MTAFLRNVSHFPKLYNLYHLYPDINNFILYSNSHYCTTVQKYSVETLLHNNGYIVGTHRCATVTSDSSNNDARRTDDQGSQWCKNTSGTSEYSKEHTFPISFVYMQKKIGGFRT